MSIRSLVENKSKLEYKALTFSLIQEIGINESVNWDAVIPYVLEFLGLERLENIMNLI
jgi:hypothetical protein